MRFFTWNEKLGLPECPYLIRWCLNFGIFSIRLHKWLSSDDQRYYHNHAWWFITFILSGSYLDITENGEELLTFGAIRFRKAEHSHKVKILKSPTWTILLTGPSVNKWGFIVNGKFKKSNKYFFENGHHPCSDGDPPVKTQLKVSQ